MKLFTLLSTVLISIAPIVASGATVTVHNSNDNGPGSLRQAVSEASFGDTIQFAVSTAIVLTSGTIPLTVNITLHGQGPDLTIIDGNGSGPIFRIERGVSALLESLTVRNGYNPSQQAQSYGGGIRNCGQLVMNDCVLTGNNTEFGLGGGIASFPEQAGDVVKLELNRCLIGYCHGLAGSGVFNATGAQAVINESTIEDNMGPPYGSGIHNDGIMIVNRTLIAGKTRGTRGMENNGTLELNQSTITGHSLASGNGGGISNTGDLKINGSTITANTARGTGGGVYNRGTLTLKNTIIAGNGESTFSTEGLDCSGVLNSQGYNLIGDATGCVITPTTGDLIGNANNPIDPLLGPLENNGGPTRTHALLAGSPALDAGSCSDIDGDSMSVDQRGVSRPQGGACDIGAFELEKKGVPTVQLSGPITKESNRECEARVGLKANVESSQGQALTLTWKIDGTVYQTDRVRGNGQPLSRAVDFSGDFGLGKHEVVVLVEDGNGGSASSSTTVTIVDKTAPRIIEVSCNPRVLAPPKGQMVTVRLDVRATDICDSVASKIVSIAISDPGKPKTLKNSNPDWEIKGDLTVALRAEPKKRVYSITVECRDLSGNISQRTVQVRVP